ncbi:MAG: zinc-dependent peptidase, partial [Flavobacteriales bacterium]|nr:zinc-dependent peptidase [Flavobacteriales bacterium]
MLGLIVFSIAAFFGWIVYRKFSNTNTTEIKVFTEEFPTKWRVILIQKVAFYNSLSEDEKKRFENRIQQFLLNYKITGVDVEIDIVDKILVASSAVILTFGFPNWSYTTLDEVLIYPNAFNAKFETAGPDR